MLKILKNLFFFYKIPKKVFYFFDHYFKYQKYDRKLFEKKQNNFFLNCNLNREKGLIYLREIKKKLNLKSKKNTGLSSEHEVIFSSIAISKNKTISNILEIGTYDGFNALLLSKLFPNAKIDTIDLSEKDEDFINFYDRKNEINKFIKNRDKLLSLSKNINFSPMNSINLLNYNKKYDLIWIDGAHGYPVVCIDIINSLHLLKKNGFILCDDVQLNLNQQNSHRMYGSIATFETINELKKQNLVNFELFYKRLHPKNNCNEKKRKYIAVVNAV
jgi:predicted O-methyltransferase YrrM